MDQKEIESCKFRIHTSLYFGLFLISLLVSFRLRLQLFRNQVLSQNSIEQ